MFETFFKPVSSRFGFLAIFGGIVILFILGIMPSTQAWIVVKVIYFLAFISFVYLRYQSDGRTSEDMEEDTSLSAEEEGGPDWLQAENDQDIEGSFEHFLDSSLQLVKKVLVSDTVILLFANYSKKVFTVRHYVSEKEDRLLSGNTFDLLKGLPSLVLRNRTPLIENHLPEGQEILPYYKTGENPANSFAGVPIFFKDLIIGVLCIDSAVKEAFGNDDLEILKHFANLITRQLISSNRLYEYESENWVASILSECSNEMNQIQQEDKLWEYLVFKLPKVIPCDRVSVSRKADSREGEIMSLQGGTGNLRPGRTFPLSEGIVGWVIRKNQSLLVEDFSTKENYVPRFDTTETAAKEYFSLLAVPIANNHSMIGAICLESYQPRNFKEQQKRMLQTIANQTVTVYTTAKSMENLEKLCYKDAHTQLENLNAFKSYIVKEMKKADSLDLDLSLLFLKIYFQTKEEDTGLYFDTVNEFLTLALPLLTDTDYIFHLFSDTFVIAASHRGEDRTAERAKELVQKVKEKKVWANGQAFDFYMSAGLVTREFMADNVEQVVEAGQASIKQARLGGPNNFAIYRGIEPLDEEITPDMNLTEE